MEDRIVNTITRAVELGILPASANNEQQIRAKYQAYLTREVQDAALLEEQREILAFLSFLEEKGIMDELYPQGYKIKKLRPRKNSSKSSLKK